MREVETAESGDGTAAAPGDGANPKPKARGRPRGKAKGKAKAKAKAKTSAKRKNHDTKENSDERKKDEIPDEMESSALDAPHLTDTALEPETKPAEPTDSKDETDPDKNHKGLGMDANKPDETPGDHQAKPKVTRKRKVAQADPKQGDSVGNELAKNENKKKKKDQTKVAPAHEATSANPSTAAPAPDTGNGDGHKGEAVTPSAEPKMKAKKRAAPGEAQTFARRVQPSSTVGKAKWLALRKAFNQHIKPRVNFFSAHEELCFKSVCKSF